MAETKTTFIVSTSAAYHPQKVTADRHEETSDSHWFYNLVTTGSGVNRKHTVASEPWPL